MSFNMRVWTCEFQHVSFNMRVSTCEFQHVSFNRFSLDFNLAWARSFLHRNRRNTRKRHFYNPLPPPRPPVLCRFCKKQKRKIIAYCIAYWLLLPRINPTPGAPTQCFFVLAQTTIPLWGNSSFGPGIFVLRAALPKGGRPPPLPASDICHSPHALTARQ